MSEQMEATLDQPIDIGIATVKVGVAVGFAFPVLSTECTAYVLRRADADMYERKAIIKGASKAPLKLSATATKLIATR